MHLENKSLLPVSGPFSIELQNMRVNLTGFRVDNADNHRATEGARWIFAARQLAPQEVSEERLFRWNFIGVPAEPEYPFMMFKVVSTPADRAKSTTNAGGTER